MKRSRQTTLLESKVALTCSMGEVLKIPEPVCSGLKTLPVANKPKTMKKVAAACESAVAREAREATERDTAEKAAEEDVAEAAAVVKAKGEGVARERQSKQAADSASAKGSSKLTSAEADAGKPQLPATKATPEKEATPKGLDVVLVGSDSEVATGGKTVASPLPSVAFGELHRMLGSAHEVKKHEEELAHACDGYLPTKEVHTKIQELEDRERKTYAAWESAKSEVVRLKESLAAKEEQMEKDRVATESTICEIQTKKDVLEKLVLEHCRQILGMDESVLELDASDCMREFMASVIKSAADALAMLQYLSPLERVTRLRAGVPGCITWSL
ncbi:hypothetical protein ACQ4PT_032576 [Festuca glaucescens]